jgi:ribA/ribD-fused uncharacterized protein
MGLSCVTSAPAVTRFRDRYAFLSSFHERPVFYEGAWYPGSEWAFQAAKSTDPAVRAAIAQLPTARQAKACGRQLALRPDWEQVKRTVMMEVNLAKYTQLEDLRKALLHTGDAPLIEGNEWGDDYWGAVPLGYLPSLQASRLPVWRTGPSEKTWLAGHNWLGWILMTIRDLLAADGEGS